MASVSLYLRGLFREHEQVYREAWEGRQFDALYFSMLVCACLISLLGLLLNSPAVIIGAMLISPLMGPILGCGLSLTTADWGLGYRSGRNLAFSVAETVVIAVVATSLSPLRDLTPEILARTNPNLMDLIIAFFSGLAGTLALGSRRGGVTILPGVAIATAVMPPLATVGYGIGTHQYRVAAGAFMLFFTNFTAIVLSASLVFLLMGFRPQEQAEASNRHWLLRYRIAIAVAVVVLLSVPLLRTLIRASEQASMRRQVEEALQVGLGKRGTRHLDHLQLDMGRAGVTAVAAVQTAEYIPDSEIHELQQEIAGRVGTAVSLQVQQLQLAQAQQAATTRAGNALTGAVVHQDAAPAPPPSMAVQLGRVQEQLQSELGSLMAPAGVSTLQVVSMGRDGEAAVVSVRGAAGTPVAAEAWKVAAAVMAAKMGAEVRIATAIQVGRLDLQYGAKSAQVNRAQQRKLDELMARFQQQPVEYALRLRIDDEALARRRMSALRVAMRAPIVTADYLPLPEDTNVASIVALQSLEVSSGTTAGASTVTAPPQAKQSENSAPSAGANPESKPK